MNLKFSEIQPKDVTDADIPSVADYDASNNHNSTNSKDECHVGNERDDQVKEMESKEQKHTLVIATVPDVGSMDLIKETKSESPDQKCHDLEAKNNTRQLEEYYQSLLSKIETEKQLLLDKIMHDKEETEEILIGYDDEMESLKQKILMTQEAVDVIL
jgi:hypothetical protein